MLNQNAVDITTLQVNLCLSHLFEVLVECNTVLGIPSRVFFSTLSERVQSLDFRHNGTRSPHVMGESQTHSIELEMPVRTLQPEIHSTLTGEDSSKNYDADQQRLQISDLHFDKFPTPATFAC